MTEETKTKTPERQRAKSRIELLAEKQAQLPKFQRKLYGPTSLNGVQTLAGSPNELSNFLLSPVPEDMVFQAELFHKHSFWGEQKVILMIRVDSEEFQSRGTQIPIAFATKKRKSSKLNVHFDLPGMSFLFQFYFGDIRLYYTHTHTPHRKGNPTYSFALESTVFSDGNLIGKLREKASGEFILYDNGANPENKKKSFGREIRKQIGGCRILNLGALEPIKMRGLFPDTTNA